MFSPHTTARVAARTLEGRYKRYRSGNAIRKSLQMLVENAGVPSLDRKSIRAIEDYSLHTFGDRAYAPWLIFYATFQGKFKEGWIPDYFYLEKVLPRINGCYRQFGRAKSLANRILGTNALPNQGSHINGSWYDSEGHHLEVSQLEETLFSSTDKVYIKPENSNRGQGILIVSRSDFRDLALPQDQVFVVQREIEQHHWFERFHKDAVSTLRVTTASCDGQPPTHRAAYLRLGLGRVNLIKPAESLRVPVLDECGTLDAFATGPRWERYEEHPDSGHRFESLQIPHFQKAVAVCEQLHRRIPQLGLIGWDVAITSSGEIEVMEFNTNHPEIAFTEAAVGPCFTDLRFERFSQADGAGSDGGSR